MAVERHWPDRPEQLSSAFGLSYSPLKPVSIRYTMSELNWFIRSNVCIAICPFEYFFSHELYSGDRSVEYQNAGPLFDAFIKDTSSNRSRCGGQVYVRETCLPLQGSDLVQVQLAFDMLLRFLTGLPKIRPGEYKRSLSFTKKYFARK